VPVPVADGVPVQETVPVPDEEGVGEGEADHSMSCATRATTVSHTQMVKQRLTLHVKTVQSSAMGSPGPSR
jgi:hypothetical protein